MFQRIGKAANNRNPGTKTPKAAAGFLPGRATPRSPPPSRVQQQDRQLSVGVNKRLQSADAPVPGAMPPRSATRLLFRGATSSSDSRIAPRSRMDTRSRKQLLQNALHFSEGQQLRHQFLEQLGMAFIQRVHQSLGFCAAQKLVRMAPNQFSKMRRHHGHRIDNRITGGDRLLFERPEQSRPPARRRLARASPFREADDAADRRKPPASASLQVCQRPISMPRSETRYSRGRRRRLSEMCTGGTRNPISADRWRRNARTRFSNVPPCFSSTSGIS